MSDVVETVGDTTSPQGVERPMLLGVDYGRPDWRSKTWLVIPGQRPVRLIHPERYGAQESKHE